MLFLWVISRNGKIIIQEVHRYSVPHNLLRHILCQDSCMIFLANFLGQLVCVLMRSSVCCSFFFSDHNLLSSPPSHSTQSIIVMLPILMLASILYFLSQNPHNLFNVSSYPIFISCSICQNKIKKDDHFLLNKLTIYINRVKLKLN